MQAGKLVRELLLAGLQLNDQAAQALDLLCGGGDLAVDLLVLRRQAVPLRGELLCPVREMLPLAFGVGDIRILVPEPALDILDGFTVPLVLLGERGDLRVVEFLLEGVDLPRDTRDLDGDAFPVRLEPRKFLAAGLRLKEHLLQGLREGLPLPGEHFHALRKLFREHAVARNLLVDRTALRPLRLRGHRKAAYGRLDLRRLRLEASERRTDPHNLVVDRHPEPADLLRLRAAGHGAALLDKIPLQGDHPVPAHQSPRPLEGVHHHRRAEDDPEGALERRVELKEVDRVADDARVRLERREHRRTELVERQEGGPPETVLFQVTDRVGRDRIGIHDHPAEPAHRRHVERGRVLRRRPAKLRHGAVDPFHAKDGVHRPSTGIALRLLLRFKAHQALLVLPDLLLQPVKGRAPRKEGALGLGEVALNPALLCLAAGRAGSVVRRLRLFVRQFLLDLAGARLQALALRCPHPALLDEDVLLAEDLRPELLLVLKVLHPREELVLDPLDLLALVCNALLDRRELLALCRELHREVRPVDREGADLPGALLDLRLGAPAVHVDPLDCFEVLVPAGRETLDGLLGELDPAPRLLEPPDERQVLRAALFVDLFVDRMPAPACFLGPRPDDIGLTGGAPERLLLVERERMESADLLLFLPDECRTPAAVEVFQFVLPPPVLHRLLALVLERVQPRHELV